MSAFLFTSQPAMGHLTPMLTIAARLVERGHTVVFACPVPERVEQGVTGKGFRLVGLPMPVGAAGLAMLPLLRGFVETAWAARMFFAGLVPLARSLLPVIDELKPAAVVSDFGFPAAGLAAEIRGLPHAVVYSAGLVFAGPGIPPWGSGLPIGEAPGWRGRVFGWASRRTWGSIERAVARARRRLDLAPTAARGAQCFCSPWLTLLLTAEVCEAPRSDVPDAAWFVGPCFAGRQADPGDGFPYDRLAPDRPKVYVSLGTVFNDRPRVFRRIIEAFPDGRCQVVVSAGGAYEALRAGPCPEHVMLFPRVPQVGVLPRVDAVISHGGNNTVNETLAAGKPLLVMPVGGEQGDNAARVVWLGAGLRAGLNSSSPEEIGGKVRRLMEEPGFRRRTEEIAAELRRIDGTHTAARFVERLAESRKPISRPAGYPRTVTTDLAPPWEG